MTTTGASTAQVTTTAVDVTALIPRQASPGEACGAPVVEHWLVRQLHEDRQRADAARLAALMGLPAPR